MITIILEQDDLARRRRLNQGRCPEHGDELIVLEEDFTGLVCDCPRPDCDFSYVAKPGSKVAQVMSSSKRKLITR